MLSEAELDRLANTLALDAQARHQLGVHLLKASLREALEIALHDIGVPKKGLTQRLGLVAGELKKKRIDRKKLLKELKGSLAEIEAIFKVLGRVLERSLLRIEAQPLEILSVDQVVKEALKVCEVFASTLDVKVKVGKADPGLRIECRREDLMRAIFNLLSNAIQAVEKLDERWVRVEFGREGEFVCVSVTDSGKGIPRELHSRIFEKRFTTRGRQGGSGLGLSSAMEAIEIHGGRIELDEKSVNTRFRILIPQAPREK